MYKQVKVIGLALFFLQVPLAFIAASKITPEFLPGVLRAPYEQVGAGIPYYTAAVILSAAYAVLLFMLATRNPKFGIMAAGFSIFMWVVALLMLGVEVAVNFLGPKGVKAVFYGNQLWLLWFFFFHFFYLRETETDDGRGAARSAELSPMMGK